MAPAPLADAKGLLDKLKTAVSKQDWGSAKGALTQLKLKLILLPAVPPNLDLSSPTAQQELLLAREAYEQAVQLALHTQSEAAIEAAFAQLNTFYDDTSQLLPPPPARWTFAGLDLLRLLVANRIAEFHTRLELIPSEGMGCPHVAAAVQLEQWLMEGAFNKVLQAGPGLPPECGFALGPLSATVREEIASCSEAAYESLRVQDAQRLLMLGSSAELEACAQARGWTIDGDILRFPQRTDGCGATEGDASAESRMTLINHALAYTKELERIV